jgi:hypothetical protein
VLLEALEKPSGKYFMVEMAMIMPRQRTRNNGERGNQLVSGEPGTRHGGRKKESENWAGLHWS